MRAETPVPFESPDAQPVRLLVVLLVPEHATEEHLEILSELAEILSDAPCGNRCCRRPIRPASSELLSTWEPYRPAA